MFEPFIIIWIIVYYGKDKQFILSFLWNEIIHPYPDFCSCLDELLLKFKHGWLITYQNFFLDEITYACQTLHWFV